MSTATAAEEIVKAPVPAVIIIAATAWAGFVETIFTPRAIVTTHVATDRRQVRC